MATMTLVEYAKSLDMANIQRPMIEVFAASSDIFGAIPIVGFSGAAYETYEEAAMPSGMAFRGINEPAGSGQGRISPKQEASFPLDWNCDVDKAIIRRHGMGRRAIEEKLSLKRAGRLWANTFMNGDNTTEPREFNGLKKRIAQKGTVGTETNTRTIHNSASSGGAALSLAKLDQLIMMVKGGTHFIAPRASIPLWTAAARNSSLTGFVMQTWDGIGTPKMSYAGRPILFGYEREPEGDLLNFDEVASGGGSAVTGSVYLVRFAEDGIHGIEIVPLSVKDMGLLEDDITYRSHLEWDVGLADEHPYCCARLTSVTNAAIVA